MDIFVPDMYFQSIYTINYKKLKKSGIKCIIFDLNNTLVSYNVNYPSTKLLELIKSLEKDFKVHFYTLGLVGSLLLVYPYIIVLVIAGLYLLIKRRGKDNFMFLAYCFSISLMIIFGYVSGSVLDQLIITLICGFILGLIIKNMLKGVEYEES